jgi:presenilin-like A22 family membrane protease
MWIVSKGPQEVVKMVETEEPAIYERWEPPRRKCYDLLYVYLALTFVLILLQILNQMVGNFLREYALILTIGILLFLLLFTLYYVNVNPPIRSSEVVQSHAVR